MYFYHFYFTSRFIVSLNFFFVGSFRKHPSKRSLPHRKSNLSLMQIKNLHTQSGRFNQCIVMRNTFPSLPLKSHLAPGAAILVYFREEMGRQLFFPLLLSICLWSGKRKELEFTLPVHFKTDETVKWKVSLPMAVELELDEL